MRCRTAFLAALLSLTACGGVGFGPKPASAASLRTMSWQENIRDTDRKRLAALWGAWTRSLNQAVSAGQGDALAALGPLAVADAGRAGPPPPPGNYRCRSIKLGVRDEGAPRPDAPAMSVSEIFPCVITAKAGLSWFEQTAGAQRIGGTLYADGDRMIFLGSMALADEMGVMAYGADASRDQVGVLHAIGEGRWRLELPWPMWQSNLEIIEIVPG